MVLDERPVAALACSDGLRPRTRAVRAREARWRTRRLVGGRHVRTSVRSRHLGGILRLAIPLEHRSKGWRWSLRTSTLGTIQAVAASLWIIARLRTEDALRRSAGFVEGRRTLLGGSSRSARRDDCAVERPRRGRWRRRGALCRTLRAGVRDRIAGLGRITTGARQQVCREHADAGADRCWGPNGCSSGTH